MTIAVIGVGLIGGSLGLAARERLGATVRGFDPGDGVLDAAMERGAVDEACASAAEAVAGAETAFVAVPVGVVPAVFIRAPVFEEPGPGLEVLATWAGCPVAVRSGNVLAIAFHPELAGTLALHRYFLEDVAARSEGVA